MRKEFLTGLSRLVLLSFGCAVPAMAQVPGVVQHNDESFTWAYGNQNDVTYIMVMKQQTSAGNVAIINYTGALTSAPAGITPTDDASNTYTLLNSGFSATNGQGVFQWCGVQTNPAQIFTIKATTDLGSAWSKGSTTEFYNVATGAGGCASADQTWFNDATTASTSITGGSSKSTSVTGDLIHCFAANDNGGPFTSFTPGSQSGITWQLLPLSGQIWDGIPQQWGVLTTRGPINPTMTWSASAQYVNSCIALKAAASGSAPPTNKPWVLASQHGAAGSVSPGGFGPGNTTTPVKWQVPTMTTGDAIVLMMTGNANTENTTSITSTVAGDSFHQAELENDNVGSGFSEIWYACNTTASQSRILTITLPANISANNGNTMNFYEVQNVSTATGTGCFDTGGHTHGTQNTVGGTVTTTYGPVAATNEIVFGQLAVNTSGVIYSAAIGGWNYTHGNMTTNNAGTTHDQCGNGSAALPPQPIDECNGNGFTVVSSTASFNVVWSPITDDVAPHQAFGTWSTAWAAFKPATSAATSGGLNKRQKLEQIDPL